MTIEIVYKHGTKETYTNANDIELNFGKNVGRVTYTDVRGNSVTREFEISMIDDVNWWEATRTAPKSTSTAVDTEDIGG